MDAVQKDALVSKAFGSFTELCAQVNLMLDHIELFIQKRTDDSVRDLRKIHDLDLSVQCLSSAPSQLSNEIIRWFKDQPRVIDKEGVELTLLNDLWANLEALFLFFICQDFACNDYDRQKAERAYKELVQINRLIP
jgi:hypothetical protein